MARKVRYLYKLLYDKDSHEFDTFSAHIGHTTNANLNQIILGLGTYFFPVAALYKKKRAMHNGIGKPHTMKIRCYVEHMTKPNEYLAVFWVQIWTNI